MADSILRLKVESQEYDQKLKRATEGLTRYVEGCRKVGGTLEQVEKETLDYVKSIGQMETVSKSATGKLQEMTKTFVELSVQYKNMTDEEKASPFGKAMSASLDQLKTRIDQAKSELNDVNKELGNTKQAEVDTKGGLEELTSALGINIKTLAGWGTALAAGKVALDVAKDAFFASESTVDEWGRTIQSAQGLYEGFLNALNTGDISGYLSRMNDIVTAARAAYDELDKLGTMKTIQAPKVSAQQTENERIRSMIQTGRYIAPVDGRRNAVFNGREMQNGDKLTAGQIRALEKQLQNGMQNVVKLVGNEVNQTGKAIDAYYNSMAKQNGMSLQEFKKGTSSWEEFSKKMQGYDDYKKWDKQARTEFAKQGGRGNVDFDKSNPFAEFKKWGVFRVDKEGGNSYKDLVQLIQQRDQQAGQAYSMQSQAYRTMNRAEGFTVSKLMGNGGNGGNGGKTDIQFADDSIMAQEKLVSDLTQKWKTASGELRDGYLKDLEEAQKKLAEMTGKAKGPDFDKLFPDMSKANFNTGYAGSAQAKYDSARADLALGPMNLDAVNTYIGSVKGMLKDANLGDEVYTSMTEKLKDATTVSTLLQEMMERGLAGADLETTAQALKEKLLSPEGIDQTAIQSFLEELNRQIEEAGGVGLKMNADTGEVTDDKGKGEGGTKNDIGGKFKEFVSGLNQVASGLQQMGIQLPKGVSDVLGVVNGVISVVQGIGTIIGVFQTSALTANTIALGALTTAVWANVISNAIPFFANGGVVPAFAQGGTIPKFASGGLIGRAAGGMMIPGNSMSGDRLRMPVDGGRGVIGVNSGELILNKSSQNSLAASLLQAESLVDTISDYRASLGNSQQMSLASELEGGGMQNIQLEAIVTAEQLKLVQNNRGKRTGRGEVVYSKRAR